MTHHDDLHEPDLQPVADRLRAERPTLTPLELDTIQQQVRARATGPARRRTRSAQPMKSRLAILLMLAFGLLFSTSGATLAVTGFASQDNAAEFQYPDDEDEGDEVLPGEDEGGGGGAAGEQDEGAQPGRQVELGSDGDELPFTGFAALPILVGGIALLTAGAVMRRRSADDS
jgi:hypothetical protein